MGQEVAVKPGTGVATTYVVRRPNPPVALGSAAVFGGLVLALMVVGSVADLSLAQRLYWPENGFGVLFAAYGEAPALLALVAAGALSILANPPVHTALRILLALGGGGLVLVGTVVLVIRPEENWDSPLAARIVIATVLASATVWATSRISTGATWQAMCVLAAALFIVVAVELVAIQGVKFLWERPRMRMLTETGAPFAPWWTPGYEEKDALLASGVPSSEFKSFPSGHSAHATVAVMLAGFALLRDDLRTRLLFWIGAIWALSVAISRLTVGAHFLTDVSAAILITLIIAFLASVLAVKILDSRVLDRLEVPTATARPRHGGK